MFSCEYRKIFNNTCFEELLRERERERVGKIQELPNYKLYIYIYIYMYIYIHIYMNIYAANKYCFSAGHYEKKL